MTIQINFDTWEEFDKKVGSLTDFIIAMGQANLEAQIAEHQHKQQEETNDE
jgi:uncharacterized protein with ATP-grasp and redox domains